MATTPTDSMRPINPPGSFIPNMSQAMLVEEGRLLFISGHVPFDQDGAIIAPNLAAQMDLVFQNLEATLKEAGVDLSALVRITMYVKDYHPSQLPVLREVKDRWINMERPPASSLVGVAELFLPDVLVEIDAIAVLPPKP